MDPPQCVQNAMMTKDKKPFTYTPGGIDLSEVRSPRMQRRIERNANLGGVSDVPKAPQPPPQNYGPLPPSAMAVMRPQTQVQVFPGPPPPPPMQKNIPPPPPPPTGPLPTQKVTTGDNQVLERPDMTKIIPENPMALLRRTGGPAPRKSLVDQMFEEQNKSPPSPPQRNVEAQSPRYQAPVATPASPPVQQQRHPQAYQPPSQQYQPPTPPHNQYQPSYHQVQPPQPQYQPVQQSQLQYQQVQPPQPQYQPVQPPQPQYQPAQVQQRATDSPKLSGYQPPVIERQPTIPKQDSSPQKNLNANVGTLYIPPLAQQQQKVVSPPTPPERNQVQSPAITPALKEAPRPWQQKSAQQQELPPWARKDEVEQVQPQTAPQSAPTGPNMQQRWQPQAAAAPQQPVRQQAPSQQFSPRSPQVQQQPSVRPAPAQNQPSNSFPVHIEIRTVPYQQDPQPSEKNPNAVYISQPIVLQHPGPLVEPPYQGQRKPQQQYQQQPRQQVQQQQPKVDSSGARIIPIQIEGRSPPIPENERNLNRQLSWGTQPPQSNSFKVIQKITKTDDEEDDTPVTQHSARFPQEMPEQMRRMKVNDNGHFRQEIYQCDEESPRYRGGYITSRIFKFLDESAPQQNSVSRNVPVQAEGNGQPQPYVHPSEQVVPEPKKYMGSNIPSRSFKILQAMTAPPESCANANYNDEMPYNPVYNPYNYPYYPPPYWPEYYTNFYPPEQSEQFKINDKASAKGGRSAPLPASCAQPYWHDYYPSNYPQEPSESTSKMSDRSSKGSSKSGRSTPLPVPPPMPAPYWGYMPPPAPYSRPRNTTSKPESSLRPQTPKPTNDYQNSNAEESFHQYPMYPHFFDPFYYSYYYGYPPAVPHYPYYLSSTENDEYSGYSSMDEMSNYSTNRRSSLKRRNSLENSSNSVQTLRQHFEVRSKSATPRITITPTYSQENVSFNIPPNKAKEEAEDSDTEAEEDSAESGSNLCRLQSIKSVQNINVYVENDGGDEDTETETEATSEEETDEEEISIEHNGDEIIPHQLSVIYEESERGESRRSLRCSSVASEATTIAEHHSEEEEEDFLANQNVRYKINLFQETNEKFGIGKSTKPFKGEDESFTSFSFSSNNLKVPQEKNSFKAVENNTATRLVNNVSENLSIATDNDKKAAQENDNVNNQNKDVNNISDVKEDSIIKSENVCDNANPKADSVMVEVEGELVCVKLRDKRGRNRRDSQKDNAKPDDSFFTPMAQRNSVYDILKNNEEEEEIVSGGTLMRVDSFASQLEAIKRNSGLFNLEDMTLHKPNNVIKEENFDSENSEQTEDISTVQSGVQETSPLKKEDFDEIADQSEEIDFWSQIKTDDDDFTPRRRSYYLKEEENYDDDCGLDNSANPRNDDDSTNSSDSSSSESHKEENNELDRSKPSHLEEDEHDDCEETSENEESSEDEEVVQKIANEDQQRPQNNKSRSRSLEPQTIKDRIEALRHSIAQKQSKLSDKDEVNVPVKNKIEVPSESRSKTASTKSSIKSFEDYSEEEELDSGVISDVSRHISDNEEFPELRKLTRYERAATHSRLFKLLQDECDIEEEEEDDEVFIQKEDKFSKLSVRQNKLSQSRSKLSLPLNKCNESHDEKKPQINEKLVEELVQSLLRSRKAQVFRTMPKEKLYAAAVTILQEGVDNGETPSEEFSSLLSPLRGETESSSPAQTPQEFYGDYSEYNDSWSDAAPASEIMPSKAFKLLQEHLGINKLGSIEGILAKCPRILSSKNVPREVLKFLNETGSDCSSAPSQAVLQSNDVTNT